MTFAELEAMVRNGFRFTGLFATVRLSVEQQPNGATTFAAAQEAALLPGVRFRMIVPVPDRDTGEPSSANQTWDMSAESLAKARNAHDLVLDTVHSMLLALARHEADESIVYAGIRPFDPHRKREP